MSADLSLAATEARIEAHLSLWQVYEQRKADWVAAHPDAEPAEYDQATRAIATDLGI